MSLNTRISDWCALRVWIIGASSGIGAGLAQALYQCGAKIALSARRVDALKTVAKNFSSDRHLILPLDIKDPGSVERAEQHLWLLWKSYDVVVVMLGNYVPMHSWTFDRGLAEQLLAVNLHGPLNALEHVLSRLASARPWCVGASRKCRRVPWSPPELGLRCGQGGGDQFG